MGNADCENNLNGLDLEAYRMLANRIGSAPFVIKDVEGLLQGLSNNGNSTTAKDLINMLKRKGCIKIVQGALDENYIKYRLLINGTSEGDLFIAMRKLVDFVKLGLDYRLLLAILLYKAISDKYEYVVSQVANRDNIARKDAYKEANTRFRMYDEISGELITWREVSKRNDLISGFQDALRKFSSLNPDILDKNMVEALLGRTTSITTELKQRLDSAKRFLNTMDFSRASFDIFGNSYMYMLERFEPIRSKEGEVYTPLGVVKLLVRLMNPLPGKEVLDPAMGSGAMLIESYRYAISRGGAIRLYGQEYYADVAVLAKLNMLYSGIPKDVMEVRAGDSLKGLKFADEKQDFKVDYVIANPPWHQGGYGEEVLGKDAKLHSIYRYGFSPNKSADWAWVQLALHYAKEKVGIILDQGVLFRGGKEADIRLRIIRNDLVEAVIQLPTKIFYNAEASGVIIIFNKMKDETRKGKVLFVDASGLYIRHPEISKLVTFTEEHIDKVEEVYREFKSVQGFSHVVSIEEIAKDGYGLNVYKYIKTQEEDPVGEDDIKKLLKEVKELRNKRDDIEKRLEEAVMDLVTRHV